MDKNPNMDTLIGLFYMIILTAVCVFAIAHGFAWLLIPFGSILLLAIASGINDGIAEYRRMTEKH